MRGKGGTKPLPFIGSTCPVGRRPGGLGRPQARPCEHLLLLEGYAGRKVLGAWKVNPQLGKNQRAEQFVSGDNLWFISGKRSSRNKMFKVRT